MAIALLVDGGSGIAAATLHVNVTLPSGSTTGSYQTGDTIALQVELGTASHRGLFGVEVEVACAGNLVRVASVDVAAGFSSVSAADGGALVLPADRVRLVGKQAMADIDRALGADGAAVSFGTVNLEVLTDEPFDAEVVIRARAALIGAAGVVTAVLDGEASGPGGFGEGRFVIHSLGAAEPSQEAAESPESLPEQKPVSLPGRPGGDRQLPGVGHGGRIPCTPMSLRPRNGTLAQPCPGYPKRPSLTS